MIISLPYKHLQTAYLDHFGLLGRTLPLTVVSSHSCMCLNLCLTFAASNVNVYFMELCVRAVRLFKSFWLPITPMKGKNKRIRCLFRHVFHLLLVAKVGHGA